jgi:hypothetical protein
MYCVFLGRALQTVNAPNASVGSDQTAPTIITGQTAETSIATDDTILIHDTSASALRKMTRANFVSGIGGTNTPAFYAYQSSATTLSATAFTKVDMQTEVFDTASAFSSSRFTVPSGQAGKYFFHFSVGLSTGTNINPIFPILYVNGAENTNGARIRKYHNGSGGNIQTYAQSAMFSASVGDYFEVYFYNGDGSTKDSYNSSQDTFFFGYKIIE